MLETIPDPHPRLARAPPRELVSLTGGPSVKGGALRPLVDLPICLGNPPRVKTPSTSNCSGKQGLGHCTALDRADASTATQTTRNELAGGPEAVKKSSYFFHNLACDGHYARARQTGRPKREAASTYTRMSLRGTSTTDGAVSVIWANSESSGGGESPKLLGAKTTPRGMPYRSNKRKLLGQCPRESPARQSCRGGWSPRAHPLREINQANPSHLVCIRFCQCDPRWAHQDVAWCNRHYA